jgi:mRNA interferase RelE/StbE
MEKNRELSKRYAKLTDYVYPLLRESPTYGPNRKRLTGEFSDFYRFRIGDYRLFYTVDEGEQIVFIVAFRHRKDAYR